MSNTQHIIQNLMANAEYMSGIVTDDTELWDEYDDMVFHLEALDRKAKAFDKYQEIISTYVSGTESDGMTPSHIIDSNDFEHEILRVYRDYNGGNK